MVRSLMALQPMGYIRPRRPPVPKGITVQKTSSSSFHLPAAMCSATCGAYAAYRCSVSHLRMLAAAGGESCFAATAGSSRESVSMKRVEGVIQGGTVWVREPAYLLRDASRWSEI